MVVDGRLVVVEFNDGDGVEESEMKRKQSFISHRSSLNLLNDTYGYMYYISVGTNPE